MISRRSLFGIVLVPLAPFKPVPPTYPVSYATRAYYRAMGMAMRAYQPTLEWTNDFEFSDASTYEVPVTVTGPIITEIDMEGRNG